MGYPTVADVEARLGFVLHTDEAQQLQVFLEDFKVYLDWILKPLTTDSVDEGILKMIVGRHGKHFIQTIDRTPGLTSYSATVGDTSTSSGYSYDASDSFKLSSEELRMIGLPGAGIFTIQMVPGGAPWIKTTR